MASTGIKGDEKDIVYYGPHLCQRCNQYIVKAGNGAPEYLEFDSPQHPIYPNFSFDEWNRHNCPKLS